MARGCVGLSGRKSIAACVWSSYRYRPQGSPVLGSGHCRIREGQSARGGLVPGCRHEPRCSLLTTDGGCTRYPLAAGRPALDFWQGGDVRFLSSTARPAWPRRPARHSASRQGRFGLPQLGDDLLQCVLPTRSRVPLPDPNPYLEGVDLPEGGRRARPSPSLLMFVTSQRFAYGERA